MKKIYTIILMIMVICSSNYLFAQCDGRYQTEIFGNKDSLGITYGQNLDWTGANTILTMDVFQPLGDTLSLRPMIFFTHGGSFEGGASNDMDVDTLCHRFARKGYVTVSINYRVGFFPFDSINAVKAVVRAVQDQKAAIRYFKKDRATVNAFRIDTNQIWVGGSSAGALTALQCAYLDEWNEVPAWDTAWTSANGGLEGTSGNPGYSSDFRGAISLCGALGHWYWMDNSDKPMCAVHGTADPIVPYGTGWASVSGNNIIIVDGDSTINAFAPSVNTKDSLYTFIGAGHVPYAGTSTANMAYMDTTVNFVTSFVYHHLDCYLTDVPEIKDFATLVTVYPNPANDYFIITIHNYDNKPYNIELNDALGRQVLSRFNQKTREININTANISSGMYFLKVTEGNSTTVKKISVR
jgi:para-nitrobenzyl esterase